MNERNVAASVRARLLNKARADKRDFSLVLTRYALERLLYRLSISEHADHFLLKGALLFDLWFDVPQRPTRDIDLLGFGLAEAPYLVEAFKDLCRIEANDGMRFDVNSVRAQEIRKEANYAGMRVTLLGWLDGARCAVQVDVGYGDAVTPRPQLTEYPVMLKEFPAPKLMVYPRYTVVAEKLEAMISLGMANSRMKDYFDVWVLARHSEFDGSVPCEAIEATLKRRGTAVPTGQPFGLSDSFAADVQKQVQWRGFLRKNRLEALNLELVLAELQRFLMPPLQALAGGEQLSAVWSGAGWHG
ncbi:MAG: nucleotidyl transferase AbiEii/AbiGii toxin family protein [Thauera sp.]|jgi:predicted nucleotidyltransferase component of viral defense system|nr:nucleotidyl transferase AbiEii/AbiGii toxin family protein [Thauera sp.]